MSVSITSLLPLPQSASVPLRRHRQHQHISLLLVVLHMRHRPSVRLWALDIDYRRAHAGRLRLCVHARRRRPYLCSA